MKIMDTVSNCENVIVAAIVNAVVESISKFVSSLHVVNFIIFLEVILQSDWSIGGQYEAVLHGNTAFS